MWRDTLYKFLTDHRDSLVCRTVSSAVETCNAMGISAVRRMRKRRRMDDEETSDVILSYQDEIKREMFEVIDRLKTEIYGRFEHMKVVNGYFGFLQLDILLKSDNDELIDKKIDDVACFYVRRNQC